MGGKKDGMDFGSYMVINGVIQLIRGGIDYFQQRNRTMLQQQEAEANRGATQRENARNREATRENLLLQLKEQRERDALAFSRRLSEHDYVRTFERAWPLEIGPEAYRDLFLPDKNNGIVPFNILIDNRLQSRFGALVNPMWEELAALLSVSLGPDRPVCFNSNAFIKETSGRGTAVELLYTVSNNVPTLLLSPRFDGCVMTLTAHIWGDGIQKQTRTSQLSLGANCIDTARQTLKKYQDSMRIAEKAGISVANAQKIKAYERVFQEETKMLNAGGTVKDCIQAGLYGDLFSAPPEKLDEYDREIYRSFADQLARHLLIPLGQAVDSYYMESYGKAPCLLEVIKNAQIDSAMGEQLLRPYCESLAERYNSGTGMLDYQQIHGFLCDVNQAGYEVGIKADEFKEKELSECSSDEIIKAGSRISINDKRKFLKRANTSIKNGNYADAIECLERVGDDIEALVTLGQLRIKGLGGKKNRRDGLSLLTNAAEKGSCQACLILYYELRDSNKAEAMKFLKKAADADNWDALYVLADEYRQEGHFSLMEKLYVRGAQLGDPRSVTQLKHLKEGVL